MQGGHNEGVGTLSLLANAYSGPVNSAHKLAVMRLFTVNGGRFLQCSWRCPAVRCPRRCPEGVMFVKREFRASTLCVRLSQRIIEKKNDMEQMKRKWADSLQSGISTPTQNIPW